MLDVSDSAVLLGPVTSLAPNALPDILCVAQVCLEGEISKDSVASGLARGVRSAGDLIPWLIAQQFQVCLQTALVCIPAS